MKKFFALLLAVCVALPLAGCDAAGISGSDRRTVEKAQNPFGATAAIQFKGVESKVEIVREVPARYEMTFTEPSSLSGMKVTFYEDIINIEYGEMGMDVDPDRVSSSATVKMLSQVVDAVSAGDNVSIAAEDGVLLVTSVTDTGTFVLTIDRDTGNFLKLEVPGSDFVMTFDAFRYF